MPSTKRFVSNLGFYSLGTFATKLLQFIFVPIYSAFIDPADLGVYNVTIATAAFLIPLLFQSVWEGSFRFTIEKGDEGREVLSTCSKYCIGLCLVYSVVFVIVSSVLTLQYGLYILLYALGQVGMSYWQFAARALKENKAYALSSIVNSAVSIVVNLVLILIFKMGIKALFIATICGAFSMTVLLELRLHLLRDIGKYPFNRIMLIQIIKYSLPLAINMISWWMMGSCNNIIVTKFLGASQNGIFAMALKFGTLLSVVTSIITLAWQEEAFRTYGDSDQDVYFNKVLDVLIKGLLSAVVVLIPLTYVIYNYLVFREYKQGVILVAFIYLSAVFNALSCHLGSAFLARKESNIMFYTTLSGGLLCVLLSVPLVNMVGIIGASIASLCGNIFNFVVRIPLLKKRIALKVDYISLVLIFVICIFVAYISSLAPKNMFFQIIIFLLSIIVFVVCNKPLINKVYSKIVKRI